MPKRSHRLSKSRYTAGVQCHKQLWWRVHEPSAPELQADDSLQAVFDAGHRVGERAQEEFGPGTLIYLDPTNTGPAVAATREAIARGESVIFEASFFQDGVFVAVDILSQEAGGWVVTEVKSAGRVKDAYLPDAAVQTHVVQQSGLKVLRTEVMHLNKAHRHPDDGPLFIRADVSEQISAHKAEVAGEIKRQLGVLASACPDVAPGDHCTSPYACPFIERCWEALPDYHVSELKFLRKEQKAQLQALDIDTIDKIPSDFPLKPQHKRQRQAILSQKTVVEPKLKKALDRFSYPIAMLDFESVGAALPVWNGSRPLQHEPVQFSVHTVFEDGTVSHEEFLGEPGVDPRPELAGALVDSLRGANTILAWYASFEKKCIELLIDAVPEREADLQNVLERLDDLLPVVRNNVYHPAFHGSFSIKSVVPALLPELSYDSFDIADGMTATTVLEALLTRPEDVPEAERAPLRDKLLRYCKHDTYVMVELWRHLNQLASAKASA